MIAIVYSPWYHNWGVIPKKDGTPYSTQKGAFRKHPCTIWSADKIENLAWLITHGIEIANEFEYRYGKKHGTLNTLNVAKSIFEDKTQKTLEIWKDVKSFVRAMPEEIKYDASIDTIEAYRKYMISKVWPLTNYEKKPERKPSWMN